MTFVISQVNQPTMMEKERLHKLLARAGVASRRRSEIMIRNGQVRVNGQVVTKMGSCASWRHDRIEVNGALLSKPPALVYLMLHKPKGMLSTADDPEGRPTVIEQLRRTPFAETRLFPIGRLDYNAEGLLLLTNDGDLTHRLLHPRHQVAKTYLVKMQDIVSNQSLERLRNGVALRDEEGWVIGTSAPAYIQRLRNTRSNSWIEMTIFEGRKHQIKRMCQAINHFCLRLIRTEFAGLSLGDLVPGDVRPLLPHEQKLLCG